MASWFSVQTEFPYSNGTIRRLASAEILDWDYPGGNIPAFGVLASGFDNYTKKGLGEQHGGKFLPLRNALKRGYLA